MNKLLAAGAVLWMLALGTGGIVTAEMVAPGSTADAADSVAASVGLDDAQLTVFDDGSVAATADTGETRTGVKTDPDGTARVTFQSSAIDGGVESAASAGLCAAGLTGDSSPVNITVDGQNSSVTAWVTDDLAEPASNDRTPQEVVDRCSTR